MIPLISTNPSFQKVQISTGNILNLNNKLGRKSNEELLDGLKLTLECSDVGNHVELKESEGRVLRATQELNQKITENSRPEISIGAKIFLNKNSKECVEEAVNALLEILNVENVDNVVLAYHPNAVASNSMPTTPTPSSASPSSAGSGGYFMKWNSHSLERVHELKQLWTSLEKFALKKQITQLGISDLDTETLSQLHASANVAPTIAQINLASCCVVPPPLREFCTNHDIQLLTHSDPELLLPDEQFVIPDYVVDWTVRYQVYLRCRSVLTAKGYILGASKQQLKTANSSD